MEMLMYTATPILSRRKRFAARVLRALFELQFSRCDFEPLDRNRLFVSVDKCVLQEVVADDTTLAFPFSSSTRPLFLLHVGSSLHAAPTSQVHHCQRRIYRQG